MAALTKAVLLLALISASILANVEAQTGGWNCQPYIESVGRQCVKLPQFIPESTQDQCHKFIYNMLNMVQRPVYGPYGGGPYGGGPYGGGAYPIGGPYVPGARRGPDMEEEITPDESKDIPADGVVKAAVMPAYYKEPAVLPAVEPAVMPAAKPAVMPAVMPAVGSLTVPTASRVARQAPEIQPSGSVAVSALDVMKPEGVSIVGVPNTKNVGASVGISDEEKMPMPGMPGTDVKSAPSFPFPPHPPGMPLPADFKPGMMPVLSSQDEKMPMPGMDDKSVPFPPPPPLLRMGMPLPANAKPGIMPTMLGAPAMEKDPLDGRTDVKRIENFGPNPYMPPMEPPGCLMDCIFDNNHWYMNNETSNEINVKLVQAAFTANVSDTWKPIVEGAINDCADKLKKVNVSAWPKDPMMSCDMGGELFMACINRILAMKHPAEAKVPFSNEFFGMPQSSDMEGINMTEMKQIAENTCQSELDKLAVCDPYATPPPFPGMLDGMVKQFLMPMHGMPMNGMPVDAMSMGMPMDAAADDEAEEPQENVQQDTPGMVLRRRPNKEEDETDMVGPTNGEMESPLMTAMAAPSDSKIAQTENQDGVKSPEKKPPTVTNKVAPKNPGKNGKKPAKVGGGGGGQKAGQNGGQKAGQNGGKGKQGQNGNQGGGLKVNKQQGKNNPKKNQQGGANKGGAQAGLQKMKGGNNNKQHKAGQPQNKQQQNKQQQNKQQQNKKAAAIHEGQKKQVPAAGSKKHQGDHKNHGTKTTVKA